MHHYMVHEFVCVWVIHLINAGCGKLLLWHVRQNITSYDRHKHNRSAPCALNKHVLRERELEITTTPRAADTQMTQFACQISTPTVSVSLSRSISLMLMPIRVNTIKS